MQQQSLVTALQKILVPIDGSKYSQLALEQAIMIAKAFNSDVLVMTAIDSYPESTTLKLEDKLQQEAHSLIESAKAEVVKANLTCETILTVRGRPYEMIIQEGRNRDANLIVMGTHGKGGLERLLMGSVTERVIGLSPCPVLVVPASYTTMQ